MARGAAYMVYPAATISLPGLRTSSTLPLDPARYITPAVSLEHILGYLEHLFTHHFVDPEYRTDVDTRINVT